jgi:hypothetical protein
MPVLRVLPLPSILFHDVSAIVTCLPSVVLTVSEILIWELCLMQTFAAMMITVLTLVTGRISLSMIPSCCNMLMLLIVLSPPTVGRTPMLLPVVAFSLIGMTTVTLQVFSPIIMTLTAAVMFQLTVTTSAVTTSLYWLGDLTVVHNVYLSNYSRRKRRREERVM